MPRSSGHSAAHLGDRKGTSLRNDWQAALSRAAPLCQGPQCPSWRLAQYPVGGNRPWLGCLLAPWPPHEHPQTWVGHRVAFLGPGSYGGCCEVNDTTGTLPGSKKVCEKSVTTFRLFLPLAVASVAGQWTLLTKPASLCSHSNKRRQGATDHKCWIL